MVQSARKSCVRRFKRVEGQSLNTSHTLGDLASRLPQSRASPLLEGRVWLGIDDAGGPTTQGSVTVNTSHEIAVIPAKHRHADTPGNEILNLHGFVEARGAPNTPIQ